MEAINNNMKNKQKIIDGIKDGINWIRYKILLSEILSFIKDIIRFCIDKYIEISK